MAEENANRISQGILGRPRPKRDFIVGDCVYVWRRHRKVQRRNEKFQVSLFWQGPGTVIGTEGRSSVWINLRGHLLKCSPELVRHASGEERLAFDNIAGTTLDESSDARLMERLKTDPTSVAHEVIDDTGLSDDVLGEPDEPKAEPTNVQSKRAKFEHTTDDPPPELRVRTRQKTREDDVRYRPYMSSGRGGIAFNECDSDDD